MLELPVHFKNDAILVELREDGRDLPLAERVVERIVNRLRQDVETRCFFAVHVHADLQAVLLLVAGNISEFRYGAQFCQKPCRPLGELGAVGILQRVLILGAADAAVYLHVLCGLHEKRDALHGGGGVTQVFDDFTGADAALIVRFEVDVKPSGINRGVHRARANE